MFIIALIGAVDSGKTTFFKNYVNEKITEKKEITQEIRFKNANFEGYPAILIDLPGHDLFSTEKSLALSACDLVLYVTDYNKPNLDILNKFEANVPTIILLNKADLYFKKDILEPLKTYCSTEQNKLDLYNLYDAFLQKVSHIALEKPFLYFLDLLKPKDLLDNFLVFPLSLIKGWGTKELSTFLKKLVFKQLGAKDHTYLYLKNKEKNTYVSVGSAHTIKDSVLICDKTLYPLKNLIYNKATKEYELPTELIKNLNYAPLLKVYDSKKVSDNTLDSHKIDRVEIHENETLKKLSSELKIYTRVLKDLEIEIYGERWEKAELLARTLTTLNVKNTVLKQLHSQSELNENRIRLIWQEEKTKIKLKPTKYTYLSSDLYTLLNDFLSFLKKKLDDRSLKIEAEINQLAIVKLRPDCIFKNHKKQLILGANLISGTLDCTESNYYILDSRMNLFNEAKLESLQSNKKEYKKWSDLETSFALKLKIKIPYEGQPGYLLSENVYRNLKRYVKLIEEETDYHTEKTQELIKRIKNQGLIFRNIHDQ